MNHLRKRGYAIMDWCCCVNVMGRVWIICFNTVERFFGYGALPLDLLAFLEFYLKGLLTC